jgi:transposase-like protein
MENVVKRSGTEFSMGAESEPDRFHNLGDYYMNQKNGKKQKKILSPEEKLHVYHECQQPDAKIGEILRKWGLYSSDLQNIRRTVEHSALEGLRQSRPGRKKIRTVSIEEHERLQRDLNEKEKALAELSVMFTSLKKKVNLE